MGAIISKFRKEKTTYQVLESLEEKIKNIEAYTLNTQQKQKRVVGNILVISVGLYIISFIVYYFWFFPPLWKDRLIRASPLFLFPFVIFLLRSLVSWYFQRKVNRNSKKLTKMKTEKKDLLERVMEKETYKVAVEILNRFGDRQSLQRPQVMATSTTVSKSITPGKISPAPMRLPAPRPGASAPTLNTVNRYAITSTPVNLEKSLGPFRNPNGNHLGVQQPVPSPILPPPTSNLRQRPVGGGQSYGAITPYNPNQRQNLPFPIIDFDGKGVVEKMVDYLIGDGPSNRFAMICSNCAKHNGMALEEEYFYKSFRCFDCNTVNPAKKLRPGAPTLPTATPIETKKLETGTNLQEPLGSSSDSSSSSSDEENSDHEEKVPGVGDIPPVIDNEIIDEEVVENGESHEEVVKHEEGDKHLLEKVAEDEIQTDDDLIVVENIVEETDNDQTIKSIVEKKNE